MSENNSRHAHFRCLCATSAVLGAASSLLFVVAGFQGIAGVLDAERGHPYELGTETHKILISGAVFTGASLFVGVVGCIPLPSFISKRIASHSPDRSMLIENGEQENDQPVEDDQILTIVNTISSSVVSPMDQDQPPDYQSIVENTNPTVIENFPPPSYSSVLVANTTGGNENISPPSYATAAEVSSANTLPPSYEDSLRGNRDRRKSI